MRLPALFPQIQRSPARLMRAIVRAATYAVNDGGAGREQLAEDPVVDHEPDARIVAQRREAPRHRLAAGVSVL